MNDMIRLAVPLDMPRVEEIYAGARAFMAQHGNPHQWGASRPERWKLEQDIAAGNLYVICSESVIHGVFALVLGEDPTYGQIYDGAWHFSCPYGTLHRVAGDGSGGIFRQAVEFAQERSAYLRVDTHRDNLPMQRAILAAGFQLCGTIITDDGTPRLAYDRMI